MCAMQRERGAGGGCDVRARNGEGGQLEAHLNLRAPIAAGPAIPCLTHVPIVILIGVV